MEEEFVSDFEEAYAQAEGWECLAHSCANKALVFIGQQEGDTTTQLVELLSCLWRDQATDDSVVPWPGVGGARCYRALVFSTVRAYTTDRDEQNLLLTMVARNLTKALEERRRKIFYGMPEN